MSQRIFILRAASWLRAPFTLAELVVAVWQEHPHVFGLRHYEHAYPDAHKVTASVHGKNGLARRGLLEKVGVDKYRLTQAGFGAARQTEAQVVA